MRVDWIKIRASSLAELFDCPSRWKAKHIDGKDLPDSGPSHVGSGVHHATAVYDQAVLDGERIEAVDAVDLALEYVRDPNRDVRYTADYSPRVAIDAAARATLNYVQDVAPSMVYASVEQKLDPLRIRIFDDIGLELTGTLDRLRRVATRLGPADLKTGKSVVGPDGSVAVEKHGAQLGQYELLAMMAAETRGETVDLPTAIIGLNTAPNGRVGWGEINRPSDILIGTEDQPGMLHHAATIIRDELWFGNPRSMFCTASTCPAYRGCRWRFSDD